MASGKNIFGGGFIKVVVGRKSLKSGSKSTEG